MAVKIEPRLDEPDAADGADGGEEDHEWQRLRNVRHHHAVGSDALYAVVVPGCVDHKPIALPPHTHALVAVQNLSVQTRTEFDEKDAHLELAEQ